MDEIYDMMKAKLDQMYREKSDKVVFTFCEFGRLYTAINYLKQIDNILKRSGYGEQRRNAE